MFLVPRSGPASKPRVLKGNWYEEHLAEEHRLTKFAEKRQSLQQSPPSGESQPLKWTGLAGHFDKVNRPYAPRTLPSTWTGATPSTAQPSSHKELKFGDYIQIQSEKGLTLTFDMWTHTFVPKTSSDSVTESDSEMLVLASATFKKGGNGTQGVETVSRNVFQIVKCDGEEYEDETVRHGVKFRILVPNGRFEKQYALKSVPVSMSKMADDGATEVVMTDKIDGSDVFWKIRDNQRHLKSWQTPPVTSNTPLLLNHCSTNAYLTCNDEIRKKFILDAGVQVLSTTDMDYRRYESYQWRLVPVDIVTDGQK